MKYNLTACLFELQLKHIFKRTRKTILPIVFPRVLHEKQETIMAFMCRKLFLAEVICRQGNKSSGVKHRYGHTSFCRVITPTRNLIVWYVLKKKKKKTISVTNRNLARVVKQTFIKMREFAPSS